MEAENQIHKLFIACNLNAFHICQIGEKQSSTTLLLDRQDLLVSCGLVLCSWVKQLNRTLLVWGVLRKVCKAVQTGIFTSSPGICPQLKSNRIPILPVLLALQFTMRQNCPNCRKKTSGNTQNSQMGWCAKMMFSYHIIKCICVAVSEPSKVSLFVFCLCLSTHSVSMAMQEISLHPVH